MVIGEVESVAAQEVLRLEVACAPRARLDALVGRCMTHLIDHDDEEVRTALETATWAERLHGGCLSCGGTHARIRPDGRRSETGRAHRLQHATATQPRGAVITQGRVEAGVLVAGVIVGPCYKHCRVHHIHEASKLAVILE